MNQFTKEELKTILWHLVSKAAIRPGNDLAPKIQDMIENYCPHESITPQFGHIHECANCKEIVDGHKLEKSEMANLITPEMTYVREGNNVWALSGLPFARENNDDNH